MRAAPAFMALGLVTAGCGQPPSTPDWVANRDELPFCGEEVRGQGEAGNVAMRTCLFEAYQQDLPAELITTYPSIEGDLITDYIRVRQGGAVEVFRDATQDAFGSGEWERYRCAGLVAVEEANVGDVGFPLEDVFVLDGCEPLGIP